MTKSEKQQNFIPFFLMILTFDFLVAIAVATKDPVWGHLAMLWNGPIDDIMYLVAGCQALFFLLDPTGEETLGEDNSPSLQRLAAVFSEGKGLEKMFASQFMSGARVALMILPAVLIVSVFVSFCCTTSVTEGLMSFAYRHLSMTFPIFLLVGAAFSFLRLAPEVAAFWKVSCLGWVGILLMTAVDGRWNNHLFHLLSNVESLQAWAAAILWAALFAAKPILQSTGKVTPAPVVDR